ncbi:MULTISPECIES: AraC family transcriptional regulator [unclassified Beijerinckia]|uniref:helix-turn-helix domain-containing protein n=1 Tax=unclassified Beijerinckia TaxID=2638183 RepID=UPI001FCDDF01|nr:MULTISPECIES: AraC family transcriptional regulator [unclassified Beijerinckia]
MVSHPDEARFPSGIVQGVFGRVTVNALARQLAPHAHAQLNMIVKLSGIDGTFAIDDRILKLTDTTALVFNPWQPHRKLANSEGPALHLTLLIETSWLRSRESGLPMVLDTLFPSSAIEVTPAMRLAIDQLAECIIGDMHLQEQQIERVIGDLLHETILAHGSTGRKLSSRSTDARIRKAMRFLQEQAARNPNLDKVAESVGMSRSRFFEQFKGCTGVSPQQYLDTVRVAAATSALLRTERSIADLAADLGFSEQTHFSRFFVQHVGIPPGEFRRRALVLSGAGSGESGEAR